MEQFARLEKLLAYIRQRGWKYTCQEQDGLGSLDFEARGLRYHVWEFWDGTYGAESNVRSGGRQEDFLGDYQQEILEIIRQWH